MPANLAHQAFPVRVVRAADVAEVLAAGDEEQRAVGAHDRVERRLMFQYQWEFSVKYIDRIAKARVDAVVGAFRECVLLFGELFCHFPTIFEVF